MCKSLLRKCHRTFLRLDSERGGGKNKIITKVKKDVGREVCAADVGDLKAILYADGKA